MSTPQHRSIAGASAALVLAFVPGSSARRAETTNAPTLNDCLRESLPANHTLLARSAESDAADSRAKGSLAARLPRLFAAGSAQHTSDPHPPDRGSGGGVAGHLTLRCSREGRVP